MRRQPTVEEISVMPRKEMKRFCRRYKLSTKGKNWVLRERLARYVQENAPEPPPEIIEETPSDFDKLSPFDQALVRYNEEQWMESLELFNKSLDTWSDSEELWIGRGGSQYQLGRIEDSLKSFEKALELNPYSVVARKSKINVLIGMGRLDEALAVCEDLETFSGIEEWAWLRKAYVHIIKGEDKQALDYVQSILEVDDNLEEVWNLKGMLVMDKDSEAALRCFNKALELREDYAIALANKASALTRLGMVDEAKRCYDNALKLENRAEFWNNKGVLHMGADENLDALVCFGKAIELDPHHAEAWNNRGTVLRGMRKLGEALECFQNAINYSMGFDEAKVSLEEVHRRLKTAGDEEDVPIEDFLVSIPGIGKKKAQTIIEAGFKSVPALRRASLSNLSAIKGVGQNLARTIKEFLD